MKSGWTLLLLSVMLVTLAACGDGGEPPVLAQDVTVVPSARTPVPQAYLPLVFQATKGPIRPGCGDYRLLVTIETDALGAGVRVSGPAEAVDVVWTLTGPGLAYHDPPLAPRVFNEDNRGAFGIEANESHEPLQAQFVLLVSGVQQGQQLQLEMGHESPGGTGTSVTIANATNGLDAAGPVLDRFSVTQEIQTVSLDLCAADPMPLPVEAPSPLPPRLLAFFYPWWSTNAQPDPPYECGGDPFGWIREVDGQLTIVTAHLPIAQDDGQVIYQQTACWMEVTDDYGRSGWIYDVREINFLAEQMQLAKTYGLDGFAVSVHGDSPQEMDFLAGKTLPVAQAVGFLIAPLYEAPETGWTYDDQTDTEMV
ncbi:MAG TPA: hypothetical protein ENJ31_10695, partial [Anaerolineae bacterium]|nr:hypothetical protein [Anaerolineae bacterium]